MLQTAYDPAKDYWKKPREAIRSCATAGDVPGRLRSMRLTSTDPNRVRNYESSVREFLAWWTVFRPSSKGTPKSALVSVGPLDVIVNPDLEVTAGGLKYVIRIRFTRGTQLLPLERIVTTSLISEAFHGSIPAILDLETGEFSTRIGSERETLEKVAADLASRWPSN
jgi:hypothetical protein